MRGFTSAVCVVAKTLRQNKCCLKTNEWQLYGTAASFKLLVDRLLCYPLRDSVSNLEGGIFIETKSLCIVCPQSSVTSNTLQHLVDKSQP